MHLLLKSLCFIKYVIIKKKKKTVIISIMWIDDVTNQTSMRLIMYCRMPPFLKYSSSTSVSYLMTTSNVVPVFTCKFKHLAKLSRWQQRLKIKPKDVSCKVARVTAVIFIIDIYTYEYLQIYYNYEEMLNYTYIIQIKN